MESFVEPEQQVCWFVSFKVDYYNASLRTYRVARRVLRLEMVLARDWLVFSSSLWYADRDLFLRLLVGCAESVWSFCLESDMLLR